MAVVKPFMCIRPAADKAARVAALPYDVYNRKEACEAVKGNPLSFLNIDRAETQFGDDVDTYDSRVYDKARELLDCQIEEGVYVTDPEENYYLYELTMEGRSQTGIVACCSIDDYVNGVVKKHENTREDKELDRIRHVDATNAHTGPIFLAYRQNQELKALVARVKEEAPLYDFCVRGRNPPQGVDDWRQKHGGGRGGCFCSHTGHLYCRRPPQGCLRCEGGA